MTQEKKLTEKFAPKEALKPCIYQMKKDTGKSNAKVDDNEQQKLGDNNRT